MSDEEEARLNWRTGEREICYVTTDDDNDGDDEDEGIPGKSIWLL